MLYHYVIIISIIIISISCSNKIFYDISVKIYIKLLLQYYYIDIVIKTKKNVVKLYYDWIFTKMKIELNVFFKIDSSPLDAYIQVNFYDQNYQSTKTGTQYIQYYQIDAVQMET